MSKIISAIVIILTVVVVWQSVHFYSTVKTPIQKIESEALRYLEENVELDHISYIDFYHGTESFHVFEGADENEEEFIIWVPNTLETFIMKPKNAGITLEDVLLFTQRELNPKQLISVKLGMENLVPLYEIIYKDQQGRYSYYFISFKDGSYLKHYHLGM
jgi:uncharacterized protein YpmB